jgi:hypothetical protein
VSFKDKAVKHIGRVNEAFATIAGKARMIIGATQKVIHPKPQSSSTKLANPKICIVYLVSPTKEVHSVGFMGYKTQVRKIDVLNESIKTAVKYLPAYPYLIFHEDYTKADMESVRKAAKGRKVTFIKIDFKHYKNHSNIDEWMKKQKGFVEGRPSGYRMMCRFFSGVLQNHKALDEFDYYIRMDHDSFFIEPKALDVEKSIKETNFDYLYRSVWTDHKEKKGIWEFTKEYAKKNNLSLEGFKDLKMLNHKGEFNGRSPYNNFHISKISFWRSAPVKKFIKAIEDRDGSIKMHWHDTNIHSMLMGLFSATVLEKNDFGYAHNFHYSIQGSLKIKYSDNGRLKLENQ